MRRGERGSVAVMAMIMVVSTMTVAIVMVTLSGAVRTKQSRREVNRIVKNAFDGGLDYVRDMAARGVLRLPQTVTLTTGGVSQTIVLTDSSVGGISLLGTPVTPGIPSILVSDTLVYKGLSYREQTVIGRGRISTVWQYAIYDDSSVSSLNHFIRTGSAGLEGDAWFTGSLTLVNLSSRIGGDLTVTGLLTPLTMTVDGKTTVGGAGLEFPILSKQDYKNAATTNIPNNTTLAGYSFPSGSPTTGYSVVYEDDDLSLSGNFSGTGILYVEKNLTITGSITTGASDHVLIICNGNVTISATATSMDAYLYCTGTVTLSSAGPTFISRSGIVTGQLVLNRNCSFSFDPYVRDNPAEAYALKLPGVWP